ncbi:MAG: hypothetical protein Q9190_006544 [Brigantiaea leucoxantha]
MQKTFDSDIKADSDAVTILSATDTQPGHAQESVLLQGLQIPSKSSYVTSGFKFPQMLEQANVSKDDWSQFTNEIRSNAKLSSSQWVTTVGTGLGIGVLGGVVIAWLGLIPAAIISHNMRKRKEKENLKTAVQSGALSSCVNRWNQTYFNPRGLMVRIDLPGDATELGMEISSSKKGEKSASEEEYLRKKAMKKGRIVIMPMEGSQSTAALFKNLQSQHMGSSLSEAPTDASVFTDESPLVQRPKTDHYPDEPKP